MRGGKYSQAGQDKFILSFFERDYSGVFMEYIETIHSMTIFKKL